MPEYLAGKAVYEEPDEVDPVDPLVDIFWSGVNASKLIVNQLVSKT
jgi:hypothetical protein